MKLFELIGKLFKEKHNTGRVNQQIDPTQSVIQDEDRNENSFNQAEKFTVHINKQEVFKKPISITDKGFSSYFELTKETEEGLDVYRSEPIIIASCGKRIRQDEIGGRCDVCHQYECKDHVLHCKICSKCLCLKHTYFFEDPKNNITTPYCQYHFNKAISNYNTWQIMDK